MAKFWCAVLLLAWAVAVPAQKKTAAPELRLRDLEGQEKSLSAYRGRVVVLNFWAEWCGPCRREMPVLQALAKEYKEVAFIAASLDEEADLPKVRRYVSQTNLTLEVWVGATKADKARFGLPSAIPSTVIVNKRGQIVWRYNSVAREEDLRAEIGKWLKK
jgi:thiol-disulfide isomerase/thioredoxin